MAHAKEGLVRHVARDDLGHPVGHAASDVDLDGVRDLGLVGCELLHPMQLTRRGMRMTLWGSGRSFETMLLNVSVMTLLSALVTNAVSRTAWRSQTGHGASVRL